jgi:hypothetical protein
VSGWKEMQNSSTPYEEILWKLLMKQEFNNRFKEWNAETL